MVRIVIVSASPLFAEGLAAALVGVADWQVGIEASLSSAAAAGDAGGPGVVDPSATGADDAVRAASDGTAVQPASDGTAVRPASHGTAGQRGIDKAGIVGAAPDDAGAAVLVLDSQPGAGSLPRATPLVLVGDGLRGPADQRPLALLASDATPAQLRAAIQAVLLGLSVRDAGLQWALPLVIDGDHEPLTPRELEVFELLGKGLSNRDIGGVLAISAHTAKFHVGQILAKVGAATRAEAVRSGLQMGLIGL